MSSLPMELVLALRYLRPKRTFISVITLISVIGVMLGVAVLIVVISVMTGFDRQLREKLLGLNAHLRVRSEQPVAEPDEILQLIRRQPGVRGAAPYVIGQVMVRADTGEGSGRILAPLIRGVDPRHEGQVSVLPGSVTVGRFDLRGNGVVIGQALAKNLGVSVGDPVSIYSVRDIEEMDENRKAGRQDAVLPDEYEVRGIFDVGYYEFNDAFILCSLGNAQDLYDLGEAVQGFHVMVDDPDAVEEVERRLGEALGPTFQLSNWKQENSGILRALQVEKDVMFYVLFFILIVAAFGIASSLITFVVQRTREIGLLKALGATRLQILTLFLVHSLSIGILGIVLGLVLGRTAVAFRNDFLLFMRRVSGFELFPASIYSFSELPALVVPQDLAVICGGSLLICLVAGLLPAWYAARLHPVEALRYE